MQCGWRYTIFCTFICRKVGYKENDHCISSTNFLVLRYANCDYWSWYLFCSTVKVGIKLNILVKRENSNSQIPLTIWFTIISVTVVKSIATRLGRFPTHFVTIRSASVALACIIICFGCTCPKITATVIY